MAQDGFTPLHVASSVGNVVAINALLQEAGDALDVRAVDLQGRTPLHIAAERGHAEACKVLKAAMAGRSGGKPVGKAAPLDLAGRTPLAWSASKGKRAQIEEDLYAPGDPSIFPSIPLHR